jgi:hypothetical protein
MHSGQIIIWALALLALGAIIWALFQSERKPKLSKFTLTWLDAHFDALLDESKKPEALVTVASLRGTGANSYRPKYEAQLNYLIDNIAHIGHAIGQNTAAKAAATLATSIISPIGCEVTAVTPDVVYGISRDDLVRAIKTLTTT